MSEPMVSPRRGAFYLLSQEVSRHVKVGRSGHGGADEVFAGYHWYQRMAATSGDGLAEYAGVFFDRTHDEVNATVSPEYAVAETSAGPSSRSGSPAPGAPPRCGGPCDSTPG